jgi:hypothetical protein
MHYTIYYLVLHAEIIVIKVFSKWKKKIDLSAESTKSINVLWLIVANEDVLGSFGSLACWCFNLREGIVTLLQSYLNITTQFRKRGRPEFSNKLLCRYPKEHG